MFAERLVKRCRPCRVSSHHVTPRSVQIRRRTSSLNWHIVFFPSTFEQTPHNTTQHGTQLQTVFSTIGRFAFSIKLPSCGLEIIAPTAPNPLVESTTRQLPARIERSLQPSAHETDDFCHPKKWHECSLFLFFFIQFFTDDGKCF